MQADSAITTKVKALLLAEMRRQGFVRLRVDGEIRETEGLEALDKRRSVLAAERAQLSGEDDNLSLKRQ